MAEYISKVLLEIDGKEITDFKSVEEPEVEVRTAVNLMGKTGYFNRVKRYAPINVEYVIPAETSEFDFEGVEEGRLTIDYENGTRITYSGVSCTKIGGAKYDGENEATRMIEFQATGRVVE